MTKAAMPRDATDGFELQPILSVPPITSMLDVDPLIAGQKFDGYANPLTGIGSVSHDKTMAGNPWGADFIVRWMTGVQAMDRWRGSDLGGRIVETIPDEMTREGWDLTIQAKKAEGGAGGDADDANAGDVDDSVQRTDGKRRQRRARADAFPSNGAPDGGAAPGGAFPPVAPKHVPGELNTGSGEEQQQVEAINQRLDELNVTEKLRLAACYERAYGGAAILLGLDDGSNNPSEPLDLSKVKKLTHLTVFRGGWDGECIAYNYYEDVMQPKYGEVRTWQIRRMGVTLGSPAAPVAGAPVVPPPTGNGSGQGPTTYYVHESRLIIFPGKAVSNEARQQMRGWGDSIFTRVDEVLSQFNQSWGGIAILMSEWAQLILKIPNLASTLASENPADRGKILNRALLLNMTQSIARARLIDDKETIERLTVSMSGVDGVLQQFALRLAAAADMPVDLLMGQTAAGGLNKGDATVRFFYDRVAAAQVKVIVPALRRIIQTIMRCKQEVTKGIEPEQWLVTPKPLYQMNATELAALRGTQATTDVAYINAGVITPEEVAASRFGGAEYSTDTVIDLDGRAKMAADQEEQKQKMQEQFEQKDKQPAPDEKKGDPDDPVNGDTGGESPDKNTEPSSAAGGAGGTVIHIHAGAGKADGVRILRDGKKKRDPQPLRTILKKQAQERAQAEADREPERDPFDIDPEQDDPDLDDGIFDGSPDQPRAANGEWGEGGAGASSAKSEGGGKAIAPAAHAEKSPTGAKLLKAAIENGGFTFDAAHDTFTTKGYSVSAHPEHERVIADRDVTPADLDKYMADKAAPLKEPGAHFGLWHDVATSRWVMDVSHVEQDREKAISVGRKYAQDGIYDLAKGETIPVTSERENKGASREKTDADALRPFGKPPAATAVNLEDEWNADDGDGLDVE